IRMQPFLSRPPGKCSTKIAYDGFPGRSSVGVSSRFGIDGTPSRMDTRHIPAAKFEQLCDGNPLWHVSRDITTVDAIHTVFSQAFGCKEAHELVRKQNVHIRRQNEGRFCAADTRILCPHLIESQLVRMFKSLMDFSRYLNNPHRGTPRLRPSSCLRKLGMVRRRIPFDTNK